MDCRRELFPRQLGISFGHAAVLKRKVVHRVTGGLMPAPNPESTESAIAIVKHHRFGRGDGDLTMWVHGESKPDPLLENNGPEPAGITDRGEELAEPEAVATSPYRSKNPVPVCCGFDSVRLVLTAGLARALATLSRSCL